MCLTNTYNQCKGTLWKGATIKTKCIILLTLLLFVVLGCGEIDKFQLKLQEAQKIHSK